MRCIRTDQGVVSFLDTVGQDPTAASAVSELVIQLARTVSLDRLRICLLTVPNLTDLNMTLPLPITSDFLQGIVFPSLVFFKTNLPHAALVEFLAAHPTLNTLCLDACGRGTAAVCPLNGMDITNVLGIECPTACVRGTAHQQLIRLTMHTTETVPDVPTVLCSLPLPAPLASLLYLVVDVFPDDYDILERISDAAPRLQSLKLVERSRMRVSTCRDIPYKQADKCRRAGRARDGFGETPNRGTAACAGFLSWRPLPFAPQVRSSVQARSVSDRSLASSWRGLAEGKELRMAIFILCSRTSASGMRSLLLGMGSSRTGRARQVLGATSSHTLTHPTTLSSDSLEAACI